MTKEDAVAIVSEIRSDYNFFNTREEPEYRAMSMAIEALQAHPTLDDVSNAYENGYRQGKFEALQSQQKTGKWTIEDCHAATYKYCCSECNAHHRARYDFCPTCGARMVGEEE